MAMVKSGTYPYWGMVINPLSELDVYTHYDWIVWISIIFCMTKNHSNVSGYIYIYTYILYPHDIPIVDPRVILQYRDYIIDSHPYGHNNPIVDRYTTPI